MTPKLDGPRASFEARSKFFLDQNIFPDFLIHRIIQNLNFKIHDIEQIDGLSEMILFGQLNPTDVYLKKFIKVSFIAIELFGFH